MYTVHVQEERKTDVPEVPHLISVSEPFLLLQVTNDYNVKKISFIMTSTQLEWSGSFGEVVVRRIDRVVDSFIRLSSSSS